MTDDIVNRLRTWESEFDLHWTLPIEAADEIERLRAELKLRTAERDHHQKWSKNYEIEIYRLRDQIKNR